MGKRKILFIKHKNFNAKTVINDYDILSENFDVHFNNVNTTNNLLIILAFLKQFIFFLIFGLKYKLFFIWFCDYHTLIPILFGKIFNKKTIINVGGYDATNIPEIKCGAFNKDNLKNKIRASILTFCYRNCSYIITVDDSMIKNINSYIFSDSEEQRVLYDGILHFIPNLSTPIKTVYTCYDPDFFKMDSNIRKEKIVLSVGLTPNEYEFKRKGFDLLVESAKMMNDIKFILVGVSPDQNERLQKLSLNNLKVYTKLPLEQLIDFFQKAKVFAQLSLFEGLPNTLCEAMLCECIPVGSNVNGIPKAIGNNGLIVRKKNINELVDTLYKALIFDDELGKKSRSYIINNFSCEKRKNDLNKIIFNLIGN